MHTAPTTAASKKRVAKYMKKPKRKVIDEKIMIVNARSYLVLSSSCVSK